MILPNSSNVGTDRTLTSIQKILKLEPIDGADFIEKATVLGWNVVVKKGEFQVGDKCVYFEIDSFLPNSQIYDFLGTLKNYKASQGYRLKTKKLKGIISQGLALPLSFYTEFPLDKFGIGYNLTDLLGVIKYDVAESGIGGGIKFGKFPDFIPKTDEERIQKLTGLFTSHNEVFFEETLKLDGSSMTCYKISTPLKWYHKLLNLIGFKFKSHHFGVCSRNLELKRPSDKKSDFWSAAMKYNIENELPVGYAIQGELVGPKIQKNHEKVTDLEYYIFNIFDIENDKYLSPTDRVQFVENNLKTSNHVPIVNTNIKILQLTLDEMLNRVEGQSINSGTISEGRVYKSLDGNLSFKCISNKYLLKCED